MISTDLSTVGPGFSTPSLGSHAVFRAALQALSHPGRLVETVHDAHVPPPGHAASGALLLALMDASSRLWLSPSLAHGSTATWLRFHTGCTLVDEPALAQFAWVGHSGELPPFDRFAQGSDTCPDRSAICVIDVPAFDVPALDDKAGTAGGWTLRGPGIRGRTRLRVDGLQPQFTAAFASDWAANHAGFPRGVDVFLATPRLIAGLPRTTCIELEA